MAYKTDIEIAQECEKKKITDVAKVAGIDDKYLELYGNYKAKIDFSFLKDKADKKDGKLILVTAITPTPAGEGKTTTSVRKECDRSTERAFPRTCIRHQGRSSRRRICSGSSDGGHQPPLYRRLPCYRRSKQPACSNARQPHPAGQCSRHRS